MSKNLHRFTPTTEPSAPLTLSQQFAMAVKSDDRKTATVLLESSSLAHTRALFWLSILKPADMDAWVDCVANARTQPARAWDFHEAVAIGMASGVDPVLTRRLIAKLPVQSFTVCNIFALAAGHGRHDLFNALSERHRELTGAEPAINTEVEPPLYLALLRGHVDTAAELVSRGADYRNTMPDVRAPGQAVDVATAAIRRRPEASEDLSRAVAMSDRGALAAVSDEARPSATMTLKM